MSWKIVVDIINNAEVVFMELLDFKEVAYNILQNTLPYKESSKKVSLPQYVIKTNTELNRLLVKDFSSQFSALSSLVINSDNSSNSMQRLNDAVFKFDQAQKTIKSKNCVLTDDATRKQVSEKLRDVVADIIIYLCVQFKLYDIQSGVLYKSVMGVSERKGLTPNLIFDTLVGTLREVKRFWFAYEPISPYYADFQEADPVFAAESEENFYPVTDAIAEKIINGSVDVSFVRGKMLEMTSDVVVEEKDTSPMKLISEMILK